MLSTAAAQQASTHESPLSLVVVNFVADVVQEEQLGDAEHDSQRTGLRHALCRAARIDLDPPTLSQPRVRDPLSHAPSRLRPESSDDTAVTTSEYRSALCVLSASAARACNVCQCGSEQRKDDYSLYIRAEYSHSIDVNTRGWPAYLIAGFGCSARL